jgi:hypothetical protein
MVVEKRNSPTVGGKRKIACSRCNSRLGTLQNQASFILKPMLEHPMMSPQRPIHLPPSDQAILAAWAAGKWPTEELNGHGRHLTTIKPSSCKTSV